MIKLLKRTFNEVIESVFPEQCINCKKNISFQRGICHQCWSKINFIESNICKTCSHPFKNNIDQNSSYDCLNCAKSNPLYDKHRSLFVYDDISSKLIYDLKYNDKTTNSLYFGNLMYNRFKNIVDECDIIISVPIHKSKLYKRKYNQSVLIAKKLAKLSDKPVLNDSLVKVKNTIPQVGLEYNQRILNVKKSIEINSFRMNILNGKNILLIDDVMTTGSTIDECCKQLRKAKTLAINVLTVAMSVKS